MKSTPKQAHTAEEWKFGGSASMEVYEVPSGKSICKITDSGLMMDGEAEGHARLIAAAPELLELIERGLRIFGGHMGGKGDGVLHVEIEQRLNLLGAYQKAIAKAKGQT